MRSEAQVSKAHRQKKSQENQEHFSCPTTLWFFYILEKVIEITRRRGMWIDTQAASFAGWSGIVQPEK